MTDASPEGTPTESATGEASPVTRAMFGRCPRCGEGRLFAKYLKFVDKCPVCGLGFQGHDVGDGPVVPALLIIGGIVVGLALWVEVAYEPPVWVHLLLWLPLGTGLTLGILPLLKGMAVGLQYKYRSTEEDAKPGGI